MDSILVAVAYLAMLLGVVYATRGNGKRALIATGVALVALLAAPYSGGAPEAIAIHVMVLVAVGIASCVLVALSKRRK